ncbi:MAG: hypothetical protein EB071_08400 [Gammaproteobacteria bacterium]|nr:hypothetical protein [Gammaproteobacteria bacterium]
MPDNGHLDLHRNTPFRFGFKRRGVPRRLLLKNVTDILRMTRGRSGAAHQKTRREAHQETLQKELSAHRK